MPVLIVLLLGLFGVGVLVEERANEKPNAHAALAVAPTGPAWARACAFQLSAAAAGFARGAGCAGATATVSTLPSGVPYVELSLAGEEGASYQVAVTEEPQEPGDTAGWHGAPGCKGYDRGFEVVRHEHGRLARVYASGGARSLEFARAFESAADFCVERAK